MCFHTSHHPGPTRFGRAPQQGHSVGYHTETHNSSRAKLPRELIETLKQQDLPVLESYISATVKVKESHSKRMPLPFYLPKHKVTNQIAALFEELNASKT